jgi:hypothetical protein
MSFRDGLGSASSAGAGAGAATGAGASAGGAGASAGSVGSTLPAAAATGMLSTVFGQLYRQLRHLAPALLRNSERAFYTEASAAAVARGRCLCVCVCPYDDDDGCAFPLFVSPVPNVPVQFIGEHADDYGGPYREALSLAAAELSDPGVLPLLQVRSFACCARFFAGASLRHAL